MKINKGDFIDSRQFSREECERFIKLAVESGYTDAEGMTYHGNTMGLDALGVASSNKGLHLPYKHIGWGHLEDSKYGFCNNISQQFREFLDKEDVMKNAPKDATHYGVTSVGNICYYKLVGETWYFLYDTGAKRGLDWLKVFDNTPAHTPLTEIKRQFTKADLLDGMRVEFDTTDIVFYVCGKTVQADCGSFHCWGEISTLDDNLQSTKTGAKVMKVTDRDGTVVFEREQPKKKVTLELTDEQIAQVKAQFML